MVIPNFYKKMLRLNLHIFTVIYKIISVAFK